MGGSSEGGDVEQTEARPWGWLLRESERPAEFCEFPKSAQTWANRSGREPPAACHRHPAPCRFGGMLWRLVRLLGGCPLDHWQTPVRPLRLWLDGQHPAPVPVRSSRKVLVDNLANPVKLVIQSGQTGVSDPGSIDLMCKQDIIISNRKSLHFWNI